LYYADKSECLKQEIKMLKQLFKRMDRNPLLKNVSKAIQNRLANREVGRIATHFKQYFHTTIAVTDETRNRSFNIRHDVYCRELNFEPVRKDSLEKDEFDSHSIHCLVQHKQSNQFAGTVRMVMSNSKLQKLPIEQFCDHALEHEYLHPKNFSRDEICEISRLAVPAKFRKRKSDNFAGAETGGIDQSVFSDKELRCFPFIAISLYFMAATVTQQRGINHIFVMMEPRLARSLRFVGIPFTQIGKVTDYHGKRAPYHIDPKVLFETLSPGFRKLMDVIGDEMKEQLTS
jgi:N-acyl amino acid synthase of PEP-CTERM/exosortase system